MEDVTLFVDSLTQAWTQLAHYLPRIAVAILMLLMGWGIAKFLRRVTIRVLRLLRVDLLAERSGVEDFLIQGGVRLTAVTILANLLYWLIMLTVILAALIVLGLPAAAELFNRIILYVPNVIVAVLVLMFGSLFARLVKGAVYAYINNVGVEGSAAVSTAAYWAVLVFVVSVALEQLSIGGQILISAFQIAFGALCLALALAFGLGGREWARKVLDRGIKGK
jgi:hypothetical protein